jgi:cysteine desulfurase
VGAFAVALEEAQARVASRVKEITTIRDLLWGEIKKLFPDALLHGPALEKRVANNLNFSIPGLLGEMAVVALNAQGVAAATRSACDSGEEGPSHVLEALGVAPQRAQEAIRLTLLPDASTSDAYAVARALQKIAKLYRNVV